VTRVLLVNPPSLQRVGTPLLGLQYLASALLQAGCDVKVIDAAAHCFDKDHQWIVAEADAFDPQIVGFTLYTRWVGHTYQLSQLMKGRYPLLIAGGPHATACPDETLLQGFDVAVVGEGEQTIVRLLDVIRGRTSLEQVHGIAYRAADGSIRRGPDAGPISNLDALPFPIESQYLFNPRWYSESDSQILPGGVVTSRGCPSNCIFCANYVTGRKVHFRSAANVVAELNAAYRRNTATTFFQIWDDAFTADSRRVTELCTALRNDLEFPLLFSASTKVTMVQPDMLRMLKGAGLSAIVFGAESGDDDILRSVGKGITTSDVVQALEWSKAAGLTTVCDFMLGFPQDTPESLRRTLAFMEQIAPLVDSFSTMGVVVPLPGTPLYSGFHKQYGFTDWWLRKDQPRYLCPPPLEDSENFAAYYCGDVNLEQDFFHYSDESRRLILDCLRFKGEHNLKFMGMGTRP
jgi:magnesium-protoporphyrin IX monomethyl ester (oxidative) cyclase